MLAPITSSPGQSWLWAKQNPEVKLNFLGLCCFFSKHTVLELLYKKEKRPSSSQYSHTKLSERMQVLLG